MQHLIFLIATLLILLIMLACQTLTVKRSQNFFMFIGLASLPPFYNFCGFVRFSKVSEKTSILKYVLGIMLVPFAAFLIFNFYNGANYKTIYLIIIVAAYIFVLFSLIKIAALIIKEKNLINKFFKTPKANFLITFFLAIVMPVTGLILNQYMFNNNSQYSTKHYYSWSNNSGGIFGEFSHPIFYLLTIFNGILLLVPIAKCKKLMLPLFYVRSLLYCFIVYMCLILIPALPIGVMGLFFIVGIYAFVPLFLTWRQGKILLADYRLLKENYKRNLIIPVFIIGFLTIPAVLSAFFTYDKINFEKAVAYADQNNISTIETVDIKALERTLNSQNPYSGLKRFYSDSRFKSYYTYSNIPIVSGIYKLFVFGNKSLAWETQRNLRALFLDQDYYYNDYNYQADLSWLDSRNDNSIQLSELTHKTVYDDTIQAYRTWVDLKLTNSGKDKNEYVTAFCLPDGAYISDYYLYVGDEKKFGILTERRAALAVYQRIVSKALDPGVLHYLDEGTLELRVFPFAPYEERMAGFEIIHINDLEFNLDHNAVSIDVDTSFTKLELPNVVLLSSAEIAELPPLNKTFDYNFILDCSKNSDAEKLLKRVESYCEKHDISDGQVYLTSYRFDKHPLKNIGKLKFTSEGGFNLNLAVKDVFLNADKNKIPIIIFVTYKQENKILLPKRSVNYTSPESDYYYELNPSLRLIPYSFYTNYKLKSVNEPIIRDASSFEGVTVINDGTDKLVILSEPVSPLTNNQYYNAILLAAENKINIKNGVQNSLSYIQKSFRSHVLTPSTAFIVVETKEQEEELLKLQEEILNSMSEPAVIILIIPILFICLYMKQRHH